MTKGYRNGVRIVRFPGGRVARFHKPGTAAYARGVAKKKRMGKLLAKRFGIKKKRRSNPGKYVHRSRVYDPFTGRMVRTKPIRVLMGGTVKRSKGPRGVRGVKGPDGVWRKPNPGNGDGYFVWGHRTSVAWYPTRIEAERAAEQMNYRGGQHYTVKPAGKFNDGRGAGAQRSNPGKGYNGYPSWNAWNVSLWINNDEGLYRFARELKRTLGTARAAEAFVDQVGRSKTPDGAPYTVSSVKGAMRGM